MAAWEINRHQVAIAGTVVDARSSRPIRAARVDITAAPTEFMDRLALAALQHGARWERMTDRLDRKRTAPDGHFHFLDLPDGPYTLRASLPGVASRYGTTEATATVTRDSQGNITMATVQLAVPPTTVYGQILDDHGDPLAMARARIRGSGESTFSDSQGQYELAAIEAGARTLQISASGFADSAQAVTLTAAGDTQELDITLSVAGPDP